MQRLFLLKMLVILLVVESMVAQKIKVACIGDSVTFGAGIENREENSYPVQLQELLGAEYEVENFGYLGATLLKNGHKPYWEKPPFQKSKDFEPKIVIIHLGLNDQGNNNWPAHKEEFIGDYLELIEVYRNLPSKPKVLICKMSPTLSGHHWFEEGMRESFKEIQTKIEEIATTAKVKLINLHDPLKYFPEYLPDNLHPNKKGASIIANKVYGAISGDYGGLQLPKLYGEKMVLQRNEPVVISGTANENDQIKVTLNNSSLETKAINGTWKVIFPKMEAGGPYQLSISSEQSQNIVINEVFIGEVWLASGQSNMDFKVHQMKNAKTVLSDSLNKNIFLFSMDPKVLGPNKFTEEEKTLLNANDYFKYSGWSNANNEILSNFSAVAYAYAYNLQKELNVPVGVVCNAIGGSPIQSWVDRERMEQKHETISLLNDTWMHPKMNKWAAGRISENFGGNKRRVTRHPYDPTFLFDSGIRPIANYNFAGVIWYQGESNAHDIELHNTLFKMLIDNWRTTWGKPEMPFYFTQLSSINRSTWGAFRDSQRKLLNIPNTGMAVTLDVGHKTDVHPKQKWIVGERLSKIALANTYGKNIEYSGPALDFINVNGNKLEVHFKHDNGLKTADGLPVKDFKIAGNDGVFVPADSEINNGILYVWSSEISEPRFVRYGYTPFSEGNLINDAKLPASTFSNE